MKSLPLLILLLTALPTLARLGETKAECEKRYGKPVGTTGLGHTLYRKAGLGIAILFWKDKAARLEWHGIKPLSGIVSGAAPRRNHGVAY